MSEKVKSAEQRMENHPAMKIVYERARAAHATIVLAESEDERVAEAVKMITHEELATLILLDKNSFSRLPEEEQENLVEVVRTALAEKGLSFEEARALLASNTKYLAAAMVKAGKADGYVAGNQCPTKETIIPALQIIGTSEGYASSFFMMLSRDKEPLFYADCAFNPNPDAEHLAKIAVDTARSAQALGIEPKIAFLSFSTNGSAEHPELKKVREAIRIARKAAPELPICPHELQLDAAINPATAARKSPEDESGVAGHANVLIFPDLNSGNIAYKMDQERGGAEAIGPIFQGFNNPVNDLSRGSPAEVIRDVVAYTAMQAGALRKK